MEGNLTSCWPFLGIPLKHVSQELNRFAASIWNQGLQVIGYALGPAEVHRIGKLVAFRPVGLREGKDGKSRSAKLAVTGVYTLAWAPRAERQPRHSRAHIHHRGPVCDATQEEADAETQRS